MARAGGRNFSYSSQRELNCCVKLLSMSDIDEATKYIVDFWDRIRFQRLKKGISQKEVAESCDFETPNMKRMEAVKTNPTVRTLLKISKSLGVDLKTLVDF